MEAERQGAGIQEYVDRLLRSPDFRIPARRARLLRYLAERTAAGQPEQINEYAIGVNVFERPESFDPKTDAVVRAEVSRLRQNLRDYYAARMHADGFVLELPSRSYVPVFRAQAAPDSTNGSSPTTLGPKTRWTHIAAGTLVVLAAALVPLWLMSRTPEPPPFSLAVLPAVVGANAADFADSADAFSQEIGAALRTTRGLSVLGWMSVTGLRGSNALQEARARIPAALILVTDVDRVKGALQVRFQLYGRNSGRALWSATAPLENAAHLDAAVATLVGSYLAPVLERAYNVFAYRRTTGASRIQPVLSGLTDPGNPCAAKPNFFAGLGREAAQVEIGGMALGARSTDTRIEMFANGERAYPLCTVHTKAGVPISLRAPALVQLAADTCVLTGSAGDVPVYGDTCIVPLAGASDVRISYTCAPKGTPIDIAPLANDSGAWNEETFPAGPRILAGVPFVLPDGAKRFWDAGTPMRGARPASITVSVKQPAITRAFFLMNTIWGQPGPASYLALLFTGDRGAIFEKKLVGGVDVRDYNRGVYTNTLNGTTSRPAFDSGRGQRMDLVEVDLPPEFQQQTLDSITVTDTGRFGFQRALLWAVTVQ